MNYTASFYFWYKEKGLEKRKGQVQNLQMVSSSDCYIVTFLVLPEHHGESLQCFLLFLFGQYEFRGDILKSLVLCSEQCCICLCFSQEMWQLLQIANEEIFWVVIIILSAGYLPKSSMISFLILLFVAIVRTIKYDDS